MNRRLYFLFPDELHARHAIDNLLDGAGVDAHHIHAVARDETKLERLPATTRRQKNDSAGRLERRLWNANLGLFGLAGVGLVGSLLSGRRRRATAALGVMAATFATGALFVSRVPHVHLDEFAPALAAGEILVMVDVPRGQVLQVEEFMHHRHPEAVAGGASWSVDRLEL